MSLGLISYRFLEGAEAFQFEAPLTQPEAILSINDSVAYCKNGKLYLQADDIPCSFFGVYTPMRITVVANQEPDIEKIFKALEVEATHKPTLVEMRTFMPNNNQFTSLVADDFVVNEGSFYVDILNDANSPNSPGATQYERMINGDEMIGKYMTIMLEFNYPGETVRLRSINVSYILSSGHL